jgi:predicted SnoaL-like aldol condensation-catalyzing enzyme
MEESEFITTIYKQGKAPKLLKILDKVETHNADALKFKQFSLKRFAEHLEKNPKNNSEAITLIEQIDLHSVLLEDDTKDRI